ncbi:chromate transporter [Azospirillum picis]|uniref:Chromate transporter n=1 Tax=Azospirillum picis TaxID=488438 RepID=A0ABU0MQT1_9PROT|nr:chromate transporter [Azospirillum picis]MBP2302262.1 chromate transporter [Azospirillum picis]MDQ0535841.1 chromate transporter [Azospirillum picis]
MERTGHRNAGGSPAAGPPGAAPGRTLLPARVLLACFLRLGLRSLRCDPVAAMEEDLLVRRRWLSEPGFRSLRAYGRVAPGVPALSLAIALGRHLGGMRGAIAAAVGMIAAPAAAALTVGILFVLGRQGLARWMPAATVDHVVAAAGTGAAAASAGIAVAAGLGGLYRIGPTPGAVLTALFMIVALLLWRWPLVAVVAVALPFSLAVTRRRDGKGGGHGRAGG